MREVRHASTVHISLLRTMADGDVGAEGDVDKGEVAAWRGVEREEMGAARVWRSSFGFDSRGMAPRAARWCGAMNVGTKLVTFPVADGFSSGPH